MNLESNSNLPTVSIACITFNQSDYIKNALDGFFLQQTSFEFEIILCDDCSTDNTSEIVNDYIINHPKGYRIKYFRHERNLGMMKNGLFSLSKCTAKYIALCEGDDYWTDPLKLQEQVCFLERNDNYVMVADNSIWYDLEENKKSLFNNDSEKDINVLELLEKRQFATASVLFRNSKELQENKEKTLGDTVLWVFLSTLGKIKYRTEVTSVYRRHQYGSVMGSDRLEWAQRMEKWNLRLKEITPQIPSSIFRERNFSQYKIASEFYLRTGNYKMYFSSLYHLIKVDKLKGVQLLLKQINVKIKRKLFNS